MTPCWLLFLAAFASATLVPGFSEAGVAAMVGQGEPLTLVVLVASLGNTLGSVLNFLLGRFASRFAGRSWFPVDSTTLERAERWFARYGTWSLLFAWLPIVGDPLTFLAGTLRVGFLPFVLLVGTGKMARYWLIATVADQASRALLGG